MKKVPNRKTKVKLNKIILQVLLLILILAALITQKDSILNILTNKSKIKAGIPAGIKEGDIIKYDHKTGVDPKLLKTTIGKGTASIPGSTYEQTFDASTIDTTWHVWSIDRDKDEIMIVSDNVAPFKTKGAIDYIWYEHNMHKIASIFGYGKGAKKKAFTYKVGSQLEDTGDTAIWKTGPDGIPKTNPEGIPGITEKELEKIEVPSSGARPLRTDDIEKAFGWTESNIKTDSKFTRYGDNWGGTTTLNINYPQRKVEGINQTWDNETIAKGPKKNVTAYNRSYYIIKSNVPANTYRNILWDWNGDNYFQLGQVGLDVYSGGVSFRRGMVYSDNFHSALDYFANAAPDGYWIEYGITDSGRVVAFLSMSDIFYTKTKEKGKHGESVWDMLMVGDIVNYDHKDVLRIEDARNNIDGIKTLKTTIEKGTASIPGSTYKQDFDGNKIDTKWRVWGVDEETGDVIILSDSVAPFRTKGAIDYIWYEHNMHKIASIFGHGKGNKKKEFAYKVGSQLEDTGDTATWKTGHGGIPKTSPEGIPGIKEKELENIEIPFSSARPLRTEDIEKAFGWTESDINSNKIFDKAYTGYGTVYTRNIYFPQRDTGSNTQQWADKNIAKGPKKNVTAYNISYSINEYNVPENTYKNILWDWNGNKVFKNIQLGQAGQSVYSNAVDFSRGVLYSFFFGDGHSAFVKASNNAQWREYDNTDSARVVAFLSSSNIIYRKSSASGARQEGIWDIELRSPATKNITVNVKNKTGKDIEGGEVKLSVEGANTPVLSTGKVAFTKDKDYTITKSGIVMKDNKYKVFVEGLPTGLDYKILSHYNEKESGKTHTLEQDILSFEKEDVTYDIVIYEDGKYIAPVTVTYKGGQKDTKFSVTGILKLIDGNTECGSLEDKVLKRKNFENDVEIDTETVEFNNIKLFDEETNELKKYKLEFKKISSDNHEVEIKDNKITVTYEPPQKEISVKTSLVLLDETTKIPVTLVADKVNVKTTEIELNKSNGYKYSEKHPVNIKNGEAIKYKLDISKIDKSKYITSLEKAEDDTKIEFVLTIRPVLTLPMSGSDSMKVMGITLGICTLVGFTVRARNKWIIFLKKYEIMK